MPTYAPGTDLGAPCPDFNLMAVDGKSYSLKQFKNGKPLVVMFICNHCPYVIAIEDRLIQLGKDLAEKQVNVVAICSNDEVTYPEDSFENLKKKFYDKKYSFVYLHDKTQQVAKSFGAVCTPDFFVYDKDLRLAYRGRLDDSWKDPQLVTKRELYDVVLKLLAGQPGPADSISSMGCSIKWLQP